MGRASSSLCGAQLPRWGRAPPLLATVSGDASWRLRPRLLLIRPLDSRLRFIVLQCNMIVRVDHRHSTAPSWRAGHLPAAWLCCETAFDAQYTRIKSAPLQRALPADSVGSRSSRCCLVSPPLSVPVWISHRWHAPKRSVYLEPEALGNRESLLRLRSIARRTLPPPLLPECQCRAATDLDPAQKQLLTGSACRLIQAGRDRMLWSRRSACKFFALFDPVQSPHHCFQTSG